MVDIFCNKKMASTSRIEPDPVRELLTVDEESKVDRLKKKEEGPSSFLPVVKCIVAAFISLLVLGCAVFSKISVIRIAESLKTENKGEENARVFILLTLILMVPQFLAFICSTWGSIRYHNRPWPMRSAIVLTVFCSFLEVTGLCIFTMGTLSFTVKINGNESVAVMNCVGIVPIFWQFWKICRRTEQQPARHQGKSALLFFVCGLVQIAGFVIVIIFSKGSTLPKCSVLSLLLISVAWLPKLRKLQIRPSIAGEEETEVQPEEEEPEEEEPKKEEPKKEHLNQPGELLHRKTARTKATMIANGVKLLITPFIGFLVSWLFGHIEPKDIHSGFAKLGEERDYILSYFLGHIFASFAGYIFSIVACSMAIQKIGFSLPLTLTTPISFALLSVPAWCNDIGVACSNDLAWVLPVVVAVWLAQFLSTTYYVWKSQDFIMAKERQLFWVPSYNGVLLEQNLLINRKNRLTDEYFVNQNEMAKASCVFICTTMYHEADYEMEQLLYSLHRVDMAQDVSKRKIESHVWFDGAVKRDVLNSYVLQLISLVNKTLGVKLTDCMKFETPYGMELRWRLPGGMFFHIHLKDNLKVKNKKRWSQVMYMSYVLDYKIKQMNVREEDTYILTTDADINFNADSVEALLDLMMRDPKVGAVCGRTHPLGSGPLVWYQIFDYAIGHWFQKVANHVLGSVLCCPGCFSVYRAKALRDVLPLYATTADHAVDFLTKDMGEDRWLCTLMVQAGWRLEYCAAAENRTYCPDNFDEFFKQRRRWIPSTLANLALLISEYKMTVSNNDSVSFPFILYQAANVFSTLIGPATVILIIVGGLEYGLGFNSVISLVLLVLVTFFYGLLCLFTSQNFQLKTAKVLTLIFALLMGAVFVGLVEQIVEDVTSGRPTNGSSSSELYNTMLTVGKQNLAASSSRSKEYLLGIGVSSWYFFGLVSLFMVTALCHPTEAYCLLHGFWYLLCLPSGYLFLTIYSVCNLTDRSWGTRENKTKNESEESLQKMICDKLLWLCRGCKDSETAREPAVQPINSEEGPAVSETSSGSDYDSPPPVLEDEEIETEDNAREKQVQNNTDEETGPSLPTRPSGHLKSALKKNKKGEPRSPGSHDDKSRSQFRFPGDTRNVRFALKRTKAYTPVDEWLQGKMRQYIPNFEENGYDDISFIAGMKEKDLEAIGIDTRGHRKKLMQEIEQLPTVEIDNNVPDNVDTWLCDIGLDDYRLNFKNSSYTNPRDLEDLKIMNSADLKVVAREDLGVVKKGHFTKLAQVVKKLQYPSAIERKIREDRITMNAVRLHRLNVHNEDHGIESEFWTKLREARLLPESKAFGQHSELSEKLGELRDSVVLCLTVANLLWIILIMSLATKTDLNVAGTNPLGLSFLIVFGALIVLQFLAMLWHRVSTFLHLISRAPFRAGRNSVKVWSFNDIDLLPAPTEEELQRIRMKEKRNSLRRRHSREDFSQSYEGGDGGDESGDGGDESQPLLNKGRPRKLDRSMSPRPV